MALPIYHGQSSRKSDGLVNASISIEPYDEI